MFDKTKQWIKTIGTAAASAAVLYYFLPIWLGAFMLLVIIAHEFGHVLAAKYLGADAETPIFIPLGPLILGLSKIITDQADIHQFVALAGPLAGAFIALALLVASLLVGFYSGVWAGAWMFSYEAYAITFGSDGKKFRKWRKEYLREKEWGSTETFLVTP